MILGGARGNPKCFGGFFDGHAHVVTQLDQLRFLRVLGGELLKRFIDCQQLIVFGRGREIELREIHPLLFASVTNGAPLPGALNQDTAHGFGGSSEEMGAAIPFLIRITCQAEPGFMDQRGGLQRLAGSFIRHPMSGQPAEFFIYQGKQLLRRSGVAVLRRLQDASDIAHAAEINPPTNDDNWKTVIPGKCHYVTSLWTGSYSVRGPALASHGRSLPAPPKGERLSIRH